MLICRTEYKLRYLAETGEDPGQLAYNGYDVASFIAKQLDLSVYQGRPLDQLIKEAPMFEGYGIRLDFSKGNVNEAMFYHQYVDGLIELIR